MERVGWERKINEIGKMECVEFTLLGECTGIGGGCRREGE